MNRAQGIAHLPDGILLLVFQEAVGQNDWESELLKGNLWTIVIVSRRWRSLVLSCPSLWSRIHLTFPPDYYRDWETFNEHQWALKCCRRTKLQLERSRQHPLHLDLNTNLLMSIHASPGDPFLPQVLSSLARCISIELFGSSSLLQQYLPKTTPKNYPPSLSPRGHRST